MFPWFMSRKMSKLFKNPVFIVFLFSVVLSSLLLPLSSKISFPQNDDWVYYKMVYSFLQRDFTLNPISAPTFYLQGFLGMIFASIFGLNKLPVLTLAVSGLNIFVFMLIISKFLKQTLAVTLLLGALLFFTPLHIYSVWGFMTENYFLLFTTLAMYFVYKYDEDGKNSGFWLANLFLILSFFIRQLAFVGMIAFALYLLLTKRWKQGLVQLGVFIATYGYYVFIFPRTPEMFEKPLEFKNLLEFSYGYSLLFAILFYICAFTLPMVFYFAFKSVSGRGKLFFVGFLVSCIVAYFVLIHYFEPHKLAWGEIWYLDNTLERTGFYPRGIDGARYGFRYIFVLYKYWDLLAKAAVAVFVTALVFIKKKNLLSPAFIYILVYLGVMLITQKVYDRYLLILIEMVILFFVSRIQKFPLYLFTLVLMFALFLVFYSYQFSMDFMKLNTYVWDKSAEIHNTLNISRNDIMGTNSWKLLNVNPTHNYKYIFTFDSFKTKPELKCCWALVEEKTISFPFSIYVDPKIYLYKSTQL